MESGDKIFLYTDGVSEAENVENMLFGEENLMEIVRENVNASPLEYQ